MSVPIDCGHEQPEVCRHCQKWQQFCRCEDENELTFWQQQLSEDELPHERN